MFDFDNIQDDQTFGVANFIAEDLKPWAKVFGFVYNDDFTPKTPEPVIPQAQEGVYRTANVEKYIQPKPNVYKGIENGKCVFEFVEPLFANCIKAKRYTGPGLHNGQITIYPPYIYSTLKVIPDHQSDEVFAAAVNKLDAIITRQDMNFTDDNKHLGNSYKFDCPFYLSFLKTQVIIMPVNDSTVRNAAQNAENKSVEDFGVYCPYYEIAGFYHPAILLNLDAIRAYAAKEQLDIKDLYIQSLLTLLAYAYQDPTNSVAEDGSFEKLNKPTNAEFSLAYNEEDAAEFVKTYLK